MKQLFKFHTIPFIFFFVLNFLLLPQDGQAEEMNSQPAEAVTINVSDTVEVSSKVVRLSEIAVFEGDNEEYVQTLKKVIVGNAPKVGKTLRVSRKLMVGRINRISRPNQRAFLNMPDVINITVASTEIETDEIIGRVHEFLQKNYSQASSELEIVKVDITEGLHVPAGEDITFFFKVQRSSSRSKITVNMDVSGSNGYKVTKRIPVHINLIEETVVAIRDISSREIIGRDDVRLAFINVSDIRRKTITNLDDVIGKAATSPIKKDTPLIQGSVKEVPVINRGSAITIVADGGGFRITVPGIAQENGFQDEMIRVENINSQKKIFGKVLDSKTVLVLF